MAFLNRPFIKTFGLPILAIVTPALIWFVVSAFVEAAQGPTDGPIYYTGARIHTASGPVIEKGVMIVLKPHLALGLAATIVMAAWSVRSWAVLVAVENWIAFAVGAAYGVLTGFYGAPRQYSLMARYDF